MAERINVGYFPAIQRDLYLSRCIRRGEDAPTKVDTFTVEWPDMVVIFASDAVVSEASVEVSEQISLVTFTRRLESLLDCGAKAEDAAEWVLKFSARLSTYGQPDEVRRLLCDKIASIDSETGETIGVLKIKRRSVAVGHAKVRICPAEDLLQVIVRHTSAQGLKSVWKSLLWRLKPQYPKEGARQMSFGASAKRPILSIVAPCVIIRAKRDDYDYGHAAGWLSAKGVCVDLSKDINTTLSLETVVESDVYYSCRRAQYYCKVVLRYLPSGKPSGITVSGNAVVVEEQQRGNALPKMQSLSDWLGLGWQLPAV